MSGSSVDTYPFMDDPATKSTNHKANVTLAPLNHNTDTRTFSQGRLPETSQHPILNAPSFNTQLGGKLQKLSHLPNPNIAPIQETHPIEEQVPHRRGILAPLKRWWLFSSCKQLM